MGKASGIFLGQKPDWFREFPVKEAVLKEVFGAIRREAGDAGCRSYPGRDDIATNDVLFQDVVSRYEEGLSGVGVPADKYPHFRRWVLLLFKGGDMPKS